MNAAQLTAEQIGEMEDGMSKLWNKIIRKLTRQGYGVEDGKDYIDGIWFEDWAQEQALDAYPLLREIQ